jgi:hypothetical protein
MQTGSSVGGGPAARMGDDVFTRCRRAFLVVMLFAIPALLIGCGFLPGDYTFDPAVLDEIVGQVNASSGEQAVQQVQDGLIAHGYPIRTQLVWSFNTGPGVPGQAAALYVDANEYLLVAQANPSAQWTMGPSVSVDIYDYTLFGDFSAYVAGDLNPPVLGPGGSVLLSSGETLQYRTANGVWLLEYGRGLIPADLYQVALAPNFAIAQNVFVYASGSFVTNFIRNWVYETMGVPGGIYSLLGLMGG